MEVPFSLELPENSKDDEHDSDEEQMKRVEKAQEVPIQGFVFDIKQKDPLISKFVEKWTKEDEDSKLEAHLKEITIDDDAPDLEKHDELEAKKRRLHCWVMIKQGEGGTGRGVTDTFFIEPSTGRKYSISECPYQTIEACFNNKNFWINLNPEIKV
mgnify:CR=1 FL=1